MAANPTRPAARIDSTRVMIFLAVAFGLLLIGGGLFWYIERQSRQAQTQAELDAESKAYVKNLKLADVQLKSTKDYFQHEVIEIVGRVTNAGDRTVRNIALQCIFADATGQPVHRERVAMIKGAMAPGESRAFRLPFDTVPDTWNQAMPQLVIAQIQLQ